MKKSKIEWTDVTWNPTIGCSKVSEGCRNCYAMRMAHRHASNPKVSDDYAGLTKKTASGPEWSRIVRALPRRLKEPLGWRKPRMVFLNSMSDLFHEGIDPKFIGAVFAIVAASPKHTFQILTKRPEIMAKWFKSLPLNSEREFLLSNLAEFDEESAAKAAERWPKYTPWPLPNVWLGTSVEDAPTTHRIEELKNSPAEIYFISAEPLIGSLGDLSLEGIDWVIAGGESGPGARPVEADWIREIRDHCESKGIAFFFKQWGGVQKKKLGRELDGKTWDQMPRTQAAFPAIESIPGRFDILRNLKDDWKGKGCGKAFDHKFLANVETLVNGLINEHDTKPPYIFGSEDSEVDLEWKFPPYNVQAVIDEESQEVSLLSVRVGPGASLEDPYFFLDTRLNDPICLRLVAQFLNEQRDRQRSRQPTNADRAPFKSLPAPSYPKLDDLSKIAEQSLRNVLHSIIGLPDEIMENGEGKWRRGDSTLHSNIDLYIQLVCNNGWEIQIKDITDIFRAWSLFQDEDNRLKEQRASAIRELESYFGEDPGTQGVYWFPLTSDPQNLRIIWVETEDWPIGGNPDVRATKAPPDSKYNRWTFGSVHSEEVPLLLSGKMDLPDGWDLSTCTFISRNEIISARPQRQTESA